MSGDLGKLLRELDGQGKPPPHRVQILGPFRLAMYKNAQSKGKNRRGECIIKQGPGIDSAATEHCVKHKVMKMTLCLNMLRE